jgi:hypothetical protein
MQTTSAPNTLYATDLMPGTSSRQTTTKSSDFAAILAEKTGVQPLQTSSAKTTTAAATTSTKQQSTADVTSMTSAEMQQHAQSLFDQGKIDLTELFMLQNAGIPIGKQGANGEFIPYSQEERDQFRHTPMNYIQTAQDAIKQLEQSGYANDPVSGYQRWQHILTTLQQSVAPPSSPAIDTYA